MAARDIPGYSIYLVVFEYLDHFMHLHGLTDTQVKSLRLNLSGRLRIPRSFHAPAWTDRYTGKMIMCDTEFKKRLSSTKERKDLISCIVKLIISTLLRYSPGCNCF
jgi:hypothetical protein